MCFHALKYVFNLISMVLEKECILYICVSNCFYCLSLSHAVCLSGVEEKVGNQKSSIIYYRTQTNRDVELNRLNTVACINAEYIAQFSSRP